MRKKFFLTLVVTGAVAFCAHDELNFNVADSEDVAINQSATLQRSADINWWSTETITAEGHGIVPAGVNGIGNKRIAAKRSAMMDGYRNLVAAAGKVKITATNTLTEEKIEALIEGATVLSETYDENGNCTVVLSVPIYGIKNSFAQAAFTPVEKENFPEPTRKVVAEGNYTGLIIDCGDLELNPVLSPVIRDDKNQSVYRYENLDYDKVIVGGMIGYVKRNTVKFQNTHEQIILTSVRKKLEFVQVGSKFLLASGDKNLSRAGDNPLIIRAERLGDDNSCPVISAEDADKILSENLSSHFLDKGAVVFTSNRIRGMRM